LNLDRIWIIPAAVSNHDDDARFLIWNVSRILTEHDWIAHLRSPQIHISLSGDRKWNADALMRFPHSSRDIVERQLLGFLWLLVVTMWRFRDDEASGG
jgi:hypothetical protein